MKLKLQGKCGGSPHHPPPTKKKKLQQKCNIELESEFKFATQSWVFTTV